MVREGGLRNGKWKIENGKLGRRTKKQMPDVRDKQESPKGVSESCTDFYGNEEAK